MEHFQDALPQELRIWVTSHNPATPSEVAKLIESYDSAHKHPLKRRKNHYEEHEGTRETSNKGPLQGKQPGDQHIRNTTREKKPLSEVVCYKCDKKGHYAQNCTEKTFHVREDTRKTSLFGEGEVNGQHVKRIQINSRASRTVVKRSLRSPSDIGEETIVVTFGNGTSGEYPLALVRVKIDNEEYCVKAATFDEVLLGRDVPLHKHMVKRLSKEDQMELLQQLAKDNRIQLEERPDISDQNPMFETEADNDFYAGQEFPFVDELFGKQRKQKELLSRGQRRRHCQRWVKKGKYSSTMQLKKEQEQDADVQKWVRQEDPTRTKRVE